MENPPTTRPKTTVLRVAIVLVVVAVFAGILIAKAGADRDAANKGKAAVSLTSITSIHNDAVADYEAALKSGKPVYVLFHSLS